MRTKSILEPNQRFGNWLTISFHSKMETGNISMWKCRCDCGFEKLIRTADLVGKYTSMCIKCSNTIKNQGKILKDFGACKNKILLQVKRQATSRNLDFTLSNKEILDLVFQPCFYCGKEHSNTAKSTTGDILLSNGIDRVDNTKGYVQGNVVPCCRYCNISKFDLETKEWIENISRILENKDKILKRSETISKESTD